MVGSFGQHPGTREVPQVGGQSNLNPSTPDLRSLFWKHGHWGMPTESMTWNVRVILSLLALLPWSPSNLMIIWFLLHVTCLPGQHAWSGQPGILRPFGDCFSSSKLLSWHSDFIHQPVENLFHFYHVSSVNSEITTRSVSEWAQRARPWSPQIYAILWRLLVTKYPIMQHPNEWPWQDN